MATKCSHEESRLTCIDCSSPLCSQCLVQCPVGFRCKTCVGSVKNPLTSGTRMVVLRTLGLCVGIGFIAGWIIPFIGMPFISCFICYFFGLFTGRWLAKFIDYRLGANVTKIIVFGVLIGMSLGPYNSLPMTMVGLLGIAFTGHGLTIFGALTSMLSVIFAPACFMAGILRPTVWGERW